MAMTGHDHLRYELLAPDDIETAWKAAPVAFIPLGTYEWHGKHLPIGLDALAAHGVCLRTAARTGGLVLPPLYYGTGGGHGDYPHTIMVEPGEIRVLMRKTLARLKDFGVELAVILTGHFAGEQVEMVKDIVAEDAPDGLRVIALSNAMVENPPIAPDHAAIYETCLMMAMAPELVKLDRLPTKDEAPANDPDGNTWGPHRHDPGHALYGIFGPDPRDATEEKARALLDAAIAWLADEVEKARG